MYWLPFLDRYGNRLVWSVAKTPLGSCWMVLQVTRLVRVQVSVVSSCSLIYIVVVAETLVVLVLRTLLRAIFMWPFCVVTDFGMCCLTSAVVSPGNVKKKPLSMDLHQVSGLGIQHTSWRYLTKSTLVRREYTFDADTKGVVLLGVRACIITLARFSILSVGSMGVTQNPVG